MDMSTLDFNTLALLVAIMGSTLTIVTLMFRQFNHFDKKFDTRIGSLDTRVGGLETKVSALDTKVDALDAKVDALDAKVDALDAKVDRMGGNVSDARERLARIEGHLMAPEGFRIQRPQPSAASDPPPEDPGPVMPISEIPQS